MNQAIRQFTPSSNWISATLLTLFVVSFGLFAEAHAPTDYSNSDTANVVQMCATQSVDRNRLLVRFH
jgi:hypothetical protein